MTGPGRRSPEWPSGASTVVGVMGDPVAHSLSPRLHNAAFDALGIDWVSVGFRVPAGQAAGALDGVRALGLAGLSVTMPHKQAVAALVDELEPDAALLDAVNTVVRRPDGRLVGASTDGAGFLDALERATGSRPAGWRCAVVGAGGAARAVVLALARAGAAQVLVVNRSAGRAEAAAALAGPAGAVAGPGDLRGCDLVVQATPVGMAGQAPGSPVPASVFGPGQVAVDLVYHPATTAFLADAAAAGASPLGGLGMLVHQAALAVDRWTGRIAPREAMWAAVAGAGPTR